MKNYTLKSPKPNWVNKIFDKFSFRSKKANELYSVVMNCIEGNTDFSTYPPVHNFDLTFSNHVKKEFIEDLEMCNSDFSKISNRKFYVDITQKLSDTIDSKNSLIKYITPSDFTLSEMKQLKKDIEYYYYLKSIEPFYIENIKLDNKENKQQINIIQNNLALYVHNEFIQNISENHNTINFNKLITIETIRHAKMNDVIDKLKRKYNLKNNKISYPEAHVIDFFCCKIENLDFTKFSQRKDRMLELFGIAYGTFKEFHISRFQNGKGFPNIEIEPLEKAIIYVDYKIENKINPEYFTVELLESMYNYHQKRLNDD